LVLVFAFAVAAQLPTDVTNGYFEGRSGDLLIKKDVPSEESFMMFLNEKSTGLPVPKHEMTLFETQVADLLSYLVGTAPLNPQADRTQFPKKGFFSNPKANVLFVFDSTDTAPEMGLKHKIASEAYPDETITALTSIVTGATPSQHGIIGDAWLARGSGETISAYESWNPSRSGSRSVTIQDVFGLAYGGRSLVLSFSSKLPIARALSAKPFLLKPTSPNYGFFWNGKGFDSVYYDKAKYTATSAELFAILAQLQDSPLVLDSESNSLVVNVDGQQVSLDLNAPEVVAVVAEVSYALHLMNLLSTAEELRALVSDEVPDFFSFGFSSIKDLRNKYGRSSSQLRAVSVLVDYAVSTVVEKLNTLYQGKLLAEAVYLSSKETPVSTTQQIVAKTRATLVSQLAGEEHLGEVYPEVYLRTDIAPEQKEEACSFLQQVLSPADVEVYCLPHPSHFRSLRADTTNSTSDDDVAIFQVVVWTSVVLILGTIWAAAVMFTIDPSKDSMLYNQHSQIHIKTI